MSNYNSIITQNNTDLSGNNTDLQDLLNTINTLPSAGENLDAVLAEQAELIADIKTALEGKAGVVAETCTLTLNLQRGTGILFTTLSCVLADGSFINDGAWSTTVSGTYTFTLPKPCCIGLSNIISISGDYITRLTNTYLINGDVTVEGYYQSSATEPS